MQKVFLEVTENTPLTAEVFRMRLRGDISDIRAPGQFVNLLLEGQYLRRPISVCELAPEKGELTLVYKVVGDGTRKLAQKKPGERIDSLTGLGNGYTLADAGNAPLLLGGGVGVPPLLYLARCLREKGLPVQVVLGFNRAEDVILEQEFRALGCAVTVTTADGSYGKQGFVTDAIPQDYSYVYTCGPEPMLRAVYRRVKTGGQFSFEERMGCGFGACMGCSCRTVTGYKRICREGPVLRKEEILWDPTDCV